MPVIYMQHPIHGNKVATMEEEAAADEENGWVRCSPASPDEDETLDELEQVRDKWAEVFGKRPHHKKSLDTLLDELESAQ